MDREWTGVVLFCASTFAAAFFVLALGRWFLAWIMREWRLSGVRAIEKKREHLARAQERLAYENELRGAQRDYHLASYGHRLLRQTGDLLQKSMVIAREMESIRAGLATYSSTCYATLRCIAESSKGLSPFYPPYQVADQDPVRQQTRLQVMAVTTAACQLLEKTQKNIVLDANLVVWKINLDAARREWCPQCPVVRNPERYPDCCPVMTLAGASKSKEDGHES